MTQNKIVIKLKQKKIMKLKNSNYGYCQNSNCDETQKLKLWLNSKTQIVMKLIKPNCDDSQDETQKLKLWCNPKTQIVPSYHKQLSQNFRILHHKDPYNYWGLQIYQQSYQLKIKQFWNRQVKFNHNQLFKTLPYQR